MKNKKSVSEIIRYGIAGVTTTLVNLGMYHGLLLLGVDYRIANLIAIIGSKTYGYLVNKLFVFKSHCDSAKELATEIIKFVFARGITGIIDYFGLLFAVEIAGFDKIVSKYVIQVIVIATNYVLGKFMVFRKQDK